MSFAPGLRKQEKTYFQKAMEGLDSNRKDLDIEFHGDIVQNGRFDREPGSVTKRSALSTYNSSVESNAIKSVYRYYNISTDTAYLIQLNGQALRIGTGTTGSFGNLTTPNTLSSSSTLFTAVTYQDLCYISTGYDDIIVTDGTAAWELGACKAALKTATGLLDNAVYFYAVAFNTAADGSGTDSITGAISNKVTCTATQEQINLSYIPLGPTGTLSRKIFRVQGGESTPLEWVHLLGDNTTTIWTDNAADSGTISSAATADAGASVEFTCAAAHGLQVNDRVTVAGTTDYNGSFTVTSTSTTTKFKITDTYVDDQSGTWEIGETLGAITDDQPKGKFLYIAQERIFVTGDPDYPSTVYYSDQYLPATIQTGVADLSSNQATGHYELISEDDNDKIVGIASQLGMTYIFKQNSIRPFYIKGTPNEWSLGDIVSPVGTPAAYSIAATPYGIVYQGYRQMYLFNGQYSSPIMDTFNVTESILDSRRDKSFGYFWNNMYLMSYTDAIDGKAYNDRVLVYDMIRKQLSIDKGGPLASGTANISCFTSFKGGSEWGQLYSGDSVLGWVYTYEEGINATRLNTVTGIDAGSHSNTMAVGEENNPVLGKFVLDNMESYTTNTQAQNAWVTSGDTELVPPDLGTSSDGARTIGGTGSITVFADATGGQVTVTAASHSLAENDTVVITGTTNYNGTFTATNVTTDTFEITDTWVETETGTWTGGDITLAAGTYNYTSLTVAASKILTITGNTTIKVQGAVSNSGIIAGGSSLNIYAVSVTNESSAANIVNSAIHIRANTIDNQGTITDDPIQASTVTVTDSLLVHRHEPGSYHSAHNPVGTTASTYDEDYDTYYGASQTQQFDHSTTAMVELSFGFATDIFKVKHLAYGIWTVDGADNLQLQLYYSGQENLIYDDPQIKGQHMGTTAIETEGSWTGVSKIKLNVGASHYDIPSGLSEARIYELEVIGTDPVYDYINDTQDNLPDSNDITDFAGALQCYTSISPVNEGTRSLRVGVASGASSLNENLQKTIASLDISASTHDDVLIDVRASRSGTQFQFAIAEATIAIDTVTNASNKFTHSGHGLSNTNRIKITATGDDVPLDLSAAQLYFVVGVAGNDFQVALTSGGSAVTFSDDGTGVGFQKWNVVNVPVDTADTWETVVLDFSGVADGSKNAITTLGLTFTNTDSANTVYIDNIRTGYYADATYTSPVVEINAGTMGSMFWNENKNDDSGTYTNDVVVHTRTGVYLNGDGTAPSDTDGGDPSAYHETTLTLPAGSVIASTAAKYFQYKIVFSSNDDTGKFYPYLYKTGGYLIKATYSKISTPAETAVEFRFRTGWRNYGLAFEDKMFKKIVSLHEGDTGAFDIIVEADLEDTQTYTFSGIDLALSPKRWVSNMPSTIHGKELRLEWYKSDNNDFKVKQFGVVIEPQPII